MPTGEQLRSHPAANCWDAAADARLGLGHKLLPLLLLLLSTDLHRGHQQAGDEGHKGRHQGKGRQVAFHVPTAVE